MSRVAQYDRNITVFSPEGRLYQVEYAFKAARTSGLNAVGIKGTSCVVVAAKKRIEDKLEISTFTTSLHKVSSVVGVCTIGLLADANAVAVRSSHIAGEYQDENDELISCKHLSLKMADLAQIYTQNAYMRPYGTVSLFFGVDPDSGESQLYKVDPAGHHIGYKAIIVGSEEQSGMNTLEKLHIPKECDLIPTIDTAISSLQKILGLTLNPRDFEVAYVSREGFKRMSESELEDRLNAIAIAD